MALSAISPGLEFYMAQADSEEEAKLMKARQDAIKRSSANG